MDSADNRPEFRFRGYRSEFDIDREHILIHDEVTGDCLGRLHFAHPRERGPEGADVRLCHDVCHRLADDTLRVTVQPLGQRAGDSRDVIVLI